MAAKKGQKKTPGSGRKKGAPNKTTRTLKEAAMGALNSGKGAQAFFEELKEENPAVFANFLGKLLPSEIKTESQVSGGLVLQWQKD